MWTLAEEENERAIDEFGARHPELRAELVHRIQMVKGIRGAKRKPAETVRTIPKFVPKEARSNGPAYVVGGLVLAAVCALAFVAATVLAPPTHSAPQSTSEPVVWQVQPQGGPVIPHQPQSLDSGPGYPPSAPPAVDTDLKRSKLKIDGAPLLSVLQMMGESCSIEVDAAPGMPNPNVSVDYNDMTAMEMLRDLGKQYGFTPLDQYNGSILVVPAVDPNDPDYVAPTSGSNSALKVGG